MTYYALFPTAKDIEKRVKSLKPGILVRINATVVDDLDGITKYSKGLVGLVVKNPVWSRDSEGYLCDILISEKITAFHIDLLDIIR